MVNDRELAQLIVSEIFAAPYPPTQDKVQRIALLGGVYPNHETNLGGLNKSALTDLIEGALIKHRSY